MLRHNYVTRLVLGLSLIGVGCTNAKLTPIQDASYLSAGAASSYCTTQASSIKTNLKFIFVLDRSGSNNLPDNTVTPPTPPSDPDGSLRFGGITAFVKGYVGLTQYTYWSLVNFSTAADVVRRPANAPTFTNVSADFLTTIGDKTANPNLRVGEWPETQTIDTGATNYLSALEEVRKMIQADVDAQKLADDPVSSQYVIFFISDGAPLVLDAATNKLVLQPEGGPNGILSKVNEITRIADTERTLVDGIQLNTGYYFPGNPDPVGKSLLKDMANAGGGDALTFTGGTVIDFNKFVLPIRTPKFSMREVWVQNLSSVWMGNRLYHDSDGDGLPDYLEQQMGSNMNKIDSDDNGVSDLVEYRLYGKPCRDSLCRGGSYADPFIQCSGLAIPSTDPNAPVRYSDRDGDGLNDCEEKLVGTNMFDFDSNGDYLPDSLAFLNKVAAIQGTSDLYLDPDNDGISNYSELKQFYPLFAPNGTVPGLRSMKIHTDLILDTPDQTCYNIYVTDLATTSKDDRVRLYILENTSIIGEKRILRTAEKTAYNGAVTFDVFDFKSSGNK